MRYHAISCIYYYENRFNNNFRFKTISNLTNLSTLRLVILHLCYTEVRIGYTNYILI